MSIYVQFKEHASSMFAHESSCVESKRTLVFFNKKVQNSYKVTKPNKYFLPFQGQTMYFELNLTVLKVYNQKLVLFQNIKSELGHTFFW